MSFSKADIETALQNVEEEYRGPGGAVAVVHNGQVYRRVWGFADMEQRIPMSPRTHLPLCSISKQMACLAMVDLIQNPTPAMKAREGVPEEQLTKELDSMLPQLANVEGGPLQIAHLHRMQSGIRDYWAMTTLWGARPDDPFSLAIDAPKALERTRSLHFEPGTEFSYSNVNFYVLARVIEKVSGQSLGQLLAERVFIKAGMTTADLSPNTMAPPRPIVGYEGDEKHGYIPTVNRIEWSGDAGVVATLEDMIAYEKWLHESWNDPNSVYRIMTEPPKYKDGSPAYYAYGLGHGESAEKKWIGHGGALRGFRLERMHVPSEDLSVVVLFNHEADSEAAAESVIRSLFKYQEPTISNESAAAEWRGAFLDHETQLLIQAEPGDPGEVAITYSDEEKIKLKNASEGQSQAMVASVGKDTIHIERIRQNRTLDGIRVDESLGMPAVADIVGEYYCAETESTFTCTGNSKLMYGSFDGYCGQGPAHLMKYIGEDIWILGTPRGLDAPAPGDWTVVFHRPGGDKIEEVTVGCQLARKVTFEKRMQRTGPD